MQSPNSRVKENHHCVLDVAPGNWPLDLAFCIPEKLETVHMVFFVRHPCPRVFSLQRPPPTPQKKASAFLSEKVSSSRFSFVLIASFHPSSEKLLASSFSCVGATFHFNYIFFAFCFFAFFDSLPPKPKHLAFSLFCDGKRFTSISC